MPEQEFSWQIIRRSTSYRESAQITKVTSHYLLTKRLAIISIKDMRLFCLVIKYKTFLNIKTNFFLMNGAENL